MRKGTIGDNFSSSNNGQNVKNILFLQLSIFFCSLLENSDFWFISVYLYVYIFVSCKCRIDMNYKVSLRLYK